MQNIQNKRIYLLHENMFMFQIWNMKCVNLFGWWIFIQLGTYIDIYLNNSFHYGYCLQKWEIIWNRLQYVFVKYIQGKNVFTVLNVLHFELIPVFVWFRLLISSWMFCSLWSLLCTIPLQLKRLYQRHDVCKTKIVNPVKENVLINVFQNKVFEQ